jgi:hypothetical protein
MSSKSPNLHVLTRLDETAKSVNVIENNARPLVLSAQRPYFASCSQAAGNQEPLDKVKSALNRQGQ